MAWMLPKESLLVSPHGMVKETGVGWEQMLAAASDPVRQALAHSLTQPAPALSPQQLLPVLCAICQSVLTIPPQTHSGPRPLLVQSS